MPVQGYKFKTYTGWKWAIPFYTHAPPFEGAGNPQGREGSSWWKIHGGKRQFPQQGQCRKQQNPEGCAENNTIPGVCTETLSIRYDLKFELSRRVFNKFPQYKISIGVQIFSIQGGAFGFCQHNVTSIYMLEFQSHQIPQYIIKSPTQEFRMNLATLKSLIIWHTSLFFSYPFSGVPKTWDYGIAHGSPYGPHCFLLFHLWICYKQGRFVPSLFACRDLEALKGPFMTNFDNIAFPWGRTFVVTPL